MGEGFRGLSEPLNQGQADCDERYHQRVIANLNCRAQAWGLQVLQVNAPALP
jgi:hypothetical protein